MNKRLLLALLVVMVLATAGCGAGGGQATADGGDGGYNEMKAWSHADLGLQNPSTQVKTGIGALGTICFLIALTKLFKKQGHMSALGWAGIMMTILLWLTFGQAIMDGVEDSWPNELSYELLDDALGRVGTVPEGDQTLGTNTLVNIVVNIVCSALRVTHGLLGAWFVIILPLAVVFATWAVGPRGGMIAVGTFMGFLVGRCMVPSQLLKETLEIQAARARVVGGLPLVSQAQAMWRNSDRMLNLDFITRWALVPLGIGAICVIFFATIAVVAGPTIGGWVVGAGRKGLNVYDDVQRRRRQAVADEDRKRQRQEQAERRAQRTMSPEEHRRRQEAAEASASEPRTLSPEETERRRKAAEAAGVHPDDLVETPSGILVPRGTAATRSSTATATPVSERSNNPHRTAQETKAKLEKDGAAQKLAKDQVQKKGDDLTAITEVAGTAASATGHSEAAAPLNVAGNAVQGTTDRVVQSSPDQDPAMAKNQQAADRVVADFAGGGEGVNA